MFQLQQANQQNGGSYEFIEEGFARLRRVQLVRAVGTRANARANPNATEKNGEWSDGVCHVECWIADDAVPFLQRQIHLEKSMRGGCCSRPGRIWAMERSLFETLRKIVDDRTMVLIGSTPEGPYRIVAAPQGFDDLDEEIPF